MLDGLLINLISFYLERTPNVKDAVISSEAVPPQHIEDSRGNIIEKIVPTSDFQE